MKKLYFLFPDRDAACQSVAKLEEAGVPLHHLHAVTQPGVALPCVHPANLLYTSQAPRGIAMGLAVGGAAGLFGGWLALTFPPPTFPMVDHVLMIATLGGAFLGALIGASLTRDRLNPKILPYEGRILRGAILLIVQVPISEITTISALIIPAAHPESDY